MKRRTLLTVYLGLMGTGLAGATQWVGYRLAYHPALGSGVRFGPLVLYPPWAMVGWSMRLRDSIPRALGEGYAFLAGVIVLATLGLIFARRIGRRLPVRQIGPDRWATRQDIERAGLLTGKGTVLGRLGRYWLTYDGPEHQLVSGASRSGKGVGHVIPTLLNWPGSVLAYDVKNELWDLTAGFRSTFSNTYFFNPTRADSARFNPLLEIRKGTSEIGFVLKAYKGSSNPSRFRSNGRRGGFDLGRRQEDQIPNRSGSIRKVRCGNMAKSNQIRELQQPQLFLFVAS